ncbi:MAG: pentapeptide repeat-containing protein, partial [bacterium]
MIYVRKWITDFRRQLGEPSGWELAGKVLAGVLALWSIMEALRAYHAGTLSRERDQAEQAYQQFLTQLGSDSELSRSGAMRQLPDLMTRQVPETDRLGTLRSIGLVWGWHFRQTPRYSMSARIGLRNYLQLPVQRKSPIEIDALLYALVQLGEEGWYDGRHHRPAPPNDLTWMWQSVSRHRECGADHTAAAVSMPGGCANHLFDGAQLAGANFTGMILDEGDFFTTNLAGASFRDAHVQNARFERGTLTEAMMLSIDAASASFRRANLSKASAILGHFPNADFSNAILDGADFSGADMRGANFSGASLRGTKIIGADLTGATMSEADLTDAIVTSTKLQGSNWRRAVIDRCDLTGSRFDGQPLLSIVRSAAGARCKDAYGIGGAACT